MSEADYEVLEKIGHGSFGIIRKVKRKIDGQILCRKEINYVKMSHKEREQLHAEFAILSSLRHPNIVGYYHREHLKSTQDLHLYMEYCGNGDLGRTIKTLQLKNQFAEEEFIWSMFSQLVTALYRCHYGVDPPEVGSNVMGLGNTAHPKQPAAGIMILHRDLKPENVFLGEDNSVKLGDFGLSKLMQSHDFASTYVGTPFYMSPEICAAERYTLKSDIWSLGCIIYELAAREPPFNGKSHFQLVQRIKEGKTAPLPNIYSPELSAVINKCLRVNPDKRPDTAELLNLPVVKLMRKEKEVVELGRVMRTKEATAVQRLRDAELKLNKIEQARLEYEASIRREWEVKARLEIDRQVQLEIEELKRKFESEVQARVAIELAKYPSAQHPVPVPVARQFSSSIEHNSSSISHEDSSHQNDIPLSSVSTSGDGDFPSTTDLTDVSGFDSPEPTQPIRKSKTPFGRAQTFAAGTPMDIEMAEPSPISIASLALSPRRTGGTKAPASGRNIFAAAAAANNFHKHCNADLMGLVESEDEDDMPILPSPTRHKPSKNNPFGTKSRPALISQKTMPTQRLNVQPNLFSKHVTAPSLPTLNNPPELRPMSSGQALKERSPSPNRRLSKIPSSANLGNNLEAPVSPTRKTSLTRKTPVIAQSATNTSSEPMPAIKNSVAPKSNASNAPRGRTLVELAQARAGGRAVDSNGNFIAAGISGDESPKGKRFADRMAARNGGSGDAPTWDPERDEMPSPFLVRQRQARRGM